MVTFTLPAQLRFLCRYNADTFYRLFFACAAQAIKDILADPRHLGGEVGFWGMLQTWTQNLRLHPHIHFMVPAVGLDKAGKIVQPKNPKWFVYGSVFASRLKTHLLRRLKKEKLLEEDLLKELRGIDWNCDVQNFGSGENAIKYLGQYVYTGPIGDSRILSSGADHIVISTKDRDTDETIPVRLDAREFVRRFLLHALPRGFQRVRYFGFLHCTSKKKLALVKDQLAALPDNKKGKSRKTPKSESSENKEARAVHCPNCKEVMTWVGRKKRAPPKERSIPSIWIRRQRAA
jgi:hypothetical protein|tara:strand:- start:423 stop:1292 length:870 start_codon:yes stop_codon:yes gene_type:complete